MPFLGTGNIERFNMPNVKGFTLIELVVVIIVLGILAVSAGARFSDSTGYAEYTYQARLISSLRNMQTRAMHDNRAGYCFQINFINTTATADAAFGPPILDYITNTTTTIDATCATDIDFGNPDYLRTSAIEMSDEGVSLSTTPSFDFIDFDGLGRPIASNQTPTCAAQCKITLTGETAVSVCVESQGYVHAC
jgi:MSHA pilin protein MshC